MIWLFKEFGAREAACVSPLSFSRSIPSPTQTLSEVPTETLAFSRCANRHQRFSAGALRAMIL
jgi:hypothetical protein